MPLEQPVFKYTHKRHVEDMLAFGRFRIGTLYEYRNVEKHGSWVGDDDEGKLKQTYQNTIGRRSSNQNLPIGLQRFFRPATPDAAFTIIGGTFTSEEVSPDYLLFSVSRSYNSAAMTDMGYDACIRIVRPEQFFKCLSRRLRHKASPVGFFPCVYRERIVNLNVEDPLAPALVKSTQYRAQDEQRFVWHPASTTPKPIIVASKQAAAYCEPYLGTRSGA